MPVVQYSPVHSEYHQLIITWDAVRVHKFQKCGLLHEIYRESLYLFK
jgi:hypothetical protein